MSELQKSYRKIVSLSFPPRVSSQPIVYNLVRDFDLCFNILKAQITPRQQGFMTVEITGLEENYRRGMDYLRAQGITITPVAQQIARDEESCMHCGLCTALCPTGALSLNLSTRMITFDPETCTGCGLCVKVCPVHAMEVDMEETALP